MKREDAVANCLRNFNVDAGETAVFLRQLEHIMATPFMTEYADIKFRSILPVSNEIPNGATEWTYRQFDEFGKAALITDMSADFPQVTVEGAELTNKIFSYGTSYQYSIQEMRQVEQANRSGLGALPLDTMRAGAARRVMERLLDKLAAVGDAKMGFSTGFVNASGILTNTKTPQQIGTTWQDSNGVMQASPGEILEDVHVLCRNIFETTKGLHAPNVLLVGTKGFSL